eukprot:jgi/Chrzof1/2989/Cz12g07060.t1
MMTKTSDFDLDICVWMCESFLQWHVASLVFGIYPYGYYMAVLFIIWIYSLCLWSSSLHTSNLITQSSG